jgi:hypothetical protein
MEFRVLGTFEVMRNGGIVTPCTPTLRRVLALLAIRANGMVSVKELMSELWAQHQPECPAAMLQTYIYQLRKLLGLPDYGHAGALYTWSNGYLLSLPTQALDWARFQALAARGADELRRGEPEAAADALRAALDEWRGPALSDVEAGPQLRAAIAHLERARESVLELAEELGLPSAPELTRAHRSALDRAEVSSTVVAPPSGGGWRRGGRKGVGSSTGSLSSSTGAYTNRTR